MKWYRRGELSVPCTLKSDSGPVTCRDWLGSHMVDGAYAIRVRMGSFYAIGLPAHVG